MSKSKATKSTEYTAMVAEAEASVSAVKDPELRRVAFEKILVTLLERQQSQSHGKKRSSLRPKRESATAQKDSAYSSGATRLGPKGHVEALIKEGFFEGKQRTIAEVKAELANQGHHIALSSLSGPLQKLTQEHRLRRQKVTADGKGSKAAFAYSNW
jgi:hypothetical protein